MAAVNPRINVVFERPLYKTIQRLAQKDGASLSLKVRDLVKEALESYEDKLLAQLAQQREKSFSRKKALSHQKAWAHLNK